MIDLSRTDGSQIAARRLRVGVDIGGTFTDFVIQDQATGSVRLAKTPTTPADLWQGIRSGLEEAEVDPAVIAMLVHGTTVGLNCFLERKGVPTGLITTAGFRDVYEIGRVNREEMYDLFYRKPEPLVPRELRLEVRERLDAAGRELIPLDEADVRDAAARFRADGVRSIAVCLLHSYANPAHEVRVREVLAEAYPEALVTLSHDLAREWREYERTSTAAINAYIAPTVQGYLSRVQGALAERGFGDRFFVNQSAGGVVSVESAQAAPVRTIMSGPAGGSVSAAYVGKLAGLPNVVAFDMGGTSTDVSLALDGEIRVTAEARIERHPVMVPMVDIRSIGAGGGSIAWLDAQGVLQVGPRSAGAAPGPACYGRGGVEPTVTDANLVLGRLPQALLGGRLALDRAAAEAAIAERIARPLELGLVEAAAGIARIVTTKMAYAIRAITVQRGLDPRAFALLAFGGAGPMHACAIAAELEIPRVVVPVAPGAFSAYGMLVSDVRHDLVRTRLQRTEEADPTELTATFAELEESGRILVEKELGEEADIVLDRSIELRYVGQEYTVKVPFIVNAVTDGALETVRADFDRLHDRAYGHASAIEPTEIVNLRLTARGLIRAPEPAEFAVGGPHPPALALLGEQPMCFDSVDGYLTGAVVDRAQLLAENVVRGPALIVETGSTTVLSPGQAATVDRLGNLAIAVD